MDIEDKKTKSVERQRKDAMEKAWLHYYNQTLLEKGLISESEWLRMKVLIELRKSK